MGKNIFFSLSGLLLGIFTGILLLYFFAVSTPSSLPALSHMQLAKPKQVIGFLPYWLLSNAQADYSSYITTLTYFAVRINADGSIVKKVTPQQDEPGWYDLQSGKADQFLQNAKEHNLSLSLTIDSGDVNAINAFLVNPSSSAATLVTSVMPIMQQHGFSDLNLDIEYTQTASTAIRMQFTQFIKAVRSSLPFTMSLTLEISPIDAIQKRLIDIAGVAPYVNTMVVMAYDYHAPDSLVSGPVAPLKGAGSMSEYDVATAITKTVQLINPQKVILGIPLYGYEWETLGTIPRSAVIPGSGVIASNKRTESFLASCATCSAALDPLADESYISYMSSDTNTNHIIFFPTISSTRAKIDFADTSGLGGLALWALGYEGNTILSPLTMYKNN